MKILQMESVFLDSDAVISTCFRGDRAGNIREFITDKVIRLVSASLTNARRKRESNAWTFDTVIVIISIEITQSGPLATIFLW